MHINAINLCSELVLYVSKLALPWKQTQNLRAPCL
jgi:hypothetical protein